MPNASNLNAILMHYEGGNGMGKSLKGKELGVGISQRSDGRYEARFIRKSGKRISIYDDKLQSLKRKLVKAQYEDINGINGINGTGENVSVSEWSEVWMSRYKSHIRHVTRKGYRTNLKLVNAHIGDMKLLDVKPMHIMEMVNSFHDDGYAVSSIKSFKALTYNLFQKAYDNELINKNPVQSIKVQFDDVQNKTKALTIEEQEKFLEVFSTSHYYEMFAFMLQTGVRIGEVLALRWSDIYWKNKEVHISRDLVYTKVNGIYMMLIESTKTSNGIRTIPLTEEAIRLLKNQRTKKLNQKKNENIYDDFVFL